MIRPNAAPGSDLSHLKFAFDRRALSFEEGVRAGLSVAVLVAAHEFLHAPILLEASLGALLTCLCDSGGPATVRVPPMFWFAVLGGALIAGFGLLRPLGYGLIPLACVGVFVFGFARIYGPAAQQVGNLLNVVLVLSLDRSFPTVAAALHFAGAFIGGGTWALLLTMVIWRLHPNRPARRAVAGAYLALAALCDDATVLLHAHDTPVEQAWERHARLHRRTVRDAIEWARVVVGQRLRGGSGAPRPVMQSLLRLESADGLFGALIALTDIIETGLDPATRPACARFTAHLATVLRVFARLIVDDTDQGLAAAGAGIATLAALARALAENAASRRVAERLVDRLRGALNLVGVAERAGEVPTPGRRIDALLAPPRANLNWQSEALRHAARVALVAAAGFVITFTWPTSYQHWLTITLVLTLQPYFALTLQRALERIGGTVLGGLFAAGLSLVCHTPLAIAAAVFPLSVLALSLRAVNFGLYITALTPMIVLLVELGAPGHGQFDIVAMRALYTVMGGALAVLGCVLLWPSWEPDRLERELHAALRCNGRYVVAALALVDGEVSHAAVEAARRAAGMASNNLEASLSRALLEPRRPGRDRLEATAVVDAALRRMAGRVTTIHVTEAPGSDVHLAAWRAWIADVVSVLDQPAPSRLPGRPETLPDDAALGEALTRIANQLELSAAALARQADGLSGGAAPIPLDV